MGRRGGPRRGADLEYPLRLSFMEAAHGVTKNIERSPTRSLCRSCEGATGSRKMPQPTVCPTCGGSRPGHLGPGLPAHSHHVPDVPRCGSDQVAPSDRCESVWGFRPSARGHRDGDSRVPAGAYRGLQIRHTEAGEAGRSRGLPPETSTSRSTSSPTRCSSVTVPMCT